MGLIPRFRLGITGKILFILLGLALISLAVFTAIALNNMARLGDYSLENIRALGTQAVDDSSSALKKQAEEELLSLAVDQAAISNTTFDKVESEVNVVTSYIVNVWANPSQFTGRHIYFQDQKPDTIYTASVSLLAPGLTKDYAADELKLCSSLDNIFIPIYRNDHNITQIYFGTISGIAQLYPWASGIDPSFDPRQRPWYTKALATRSIGWTDTVMDTVTGKPVITCFKPVYDADHQLIGVVGADMTIETINQKIIGTQVGKNGYAFLIDQNGRIIAHPSMQIAGRKLDESFQCDTLLNSSNAELAKIASEMVDGSTGIATLKLEGADKYLAYAPILRTGWSIGIVMSIDEITAPVAATKERIDTATADFAAKVHNQINDMLIILILTSLGIVVGIAGVAYLLSRMLTNPILALNKGVQVIGNGNLEHRLDIRTNDEIQDLAGAFNKMTENLKVYIRNLQETTSAKERIESELRVATEIQASMLPRLFPPFPDRKEFDLYAIMQAAREVGGDFYDFFFISQNKLCLIIGDVCGKGIPAALFMAICKTLLRTEAQHASQPDEVLFRVNNILYPDNEASMFFTGLCAILDTDTGEITVANGGHNPPLVRPAGQQFEYIQLPKGLVVGALPDTRYESRSYRLRPHDIVLMYTDGVTEAMNRDGRLYSEAGLLKCLNTMGDKNVSDIIHGVKADIELFAQGTLQSDDITMVALEYNGL